MKTYFVYLSFLIFTQFAHASESIYWCTQEDVLNPQNWLSFVVSNSPEGKIYSFKNGRVDWKNPLVMECKRLPNAMVSEGGTPPILNCWLRLGPDAGYQAILFAENSLTGIQKAILTPRGPTGPGKDLEFTCEEWMD